MRAIRIILIVLVLSGCDQAQDIPAARGFAAKEVCSRVFLGGQDSQDVIYNTVFGITWPLMWFVETEIDLEQHQVVVRDRVAIQEAKEHTTAVYREGLGCTLLVNVTAEELKAQPFQALDPPILDEQLPWPDGHAGIDSSQVSSAVLVGLSQSLDTLFLEKGDSFLDRSQTYAGLVVVDGRLVAERYASNVNKDTALVGWSMSKTVTGLLTGMLIDDGVLNLDEYPVDVPGKTQITLQNLLHMASGLRWEEAYSEDGFVTRMLFLEEDQSAYVASLPMDTEPGTEFNYSTGTTNLLSQILLGRLSDSSLQGGYDFYQTRLFHPLGITSGTIEVDESGHFIGGAWVQMTPRDWLRLGQLILQNGQWGGEQVVSEQWLEFMAMPGVSSSYGGHIQLYRDEMEPYAIPKDILLFEGYMGQFMAVVPSADLVFLRMGAAMSKAQDEYTLQYFQALSEAVLAVNEEVVEPDPVSVIEDVPVIEEPVVDEAPVENSVDIDMMSGL